MSANTYVDSLLESELIYKDYLYHIPGKKVYVLDQDIRTRLKVSSRNAIGFTKYQYNSLRDTENISNFISTIILGRYPNS